MSAQHNRGFSHPEYIRRSNDEIAVKAERLQFQSRIPLLCECGDPGCRELVLLTLADYRAARRSRPFLTAPGHGAGGAHPAA